MSKVELSSNSISTYIANWTIPPPGSVFQVLGTREIQGDESKTKFRLCLSDGVHRFTQCILQFVKPGQPVPPDFSIIQMNPEPQRIPTEAKPNSIINVNNKLIWAVGDFKVLQKGGIDIKERIGNPTPFKPEELSINMNAEVPSPGTPSPSGKAPTNGSDLPPGPSKRPVSTETRNNENDRAKLARRALFTDASSATASSHSATASIAGLNPYTNKFTIKARAVKVSDLRTWNNSRGTGHVFDVILQDASGDIKAACFNEEAKKFSQIFKENKVYFVSQAHIKTSNPRFNPTKHQYELSLTNSSEVIECTQQSSKDVPTLQYNFTRINDIIGVDADEEVDVIGICSGSEDIKEITVKKTGRQLKKRELIITDQSETTINVTMWDKKAEDYGSNVTGKVICIRKAKVSEFNGKSLSISFQSSIEVDPSDCPEAEQLKMWWDQRPADETGASISNTKSSFGVTAASIHEYSTLYDVINDVKVLDGASYHKFEAYIVDIKSDTTMYHSCQTCRKKLVDQKNGKFRCEKCATSDAKGIWRYILRAAIADFTEYQWVTFFDDTAETLLGCTAQKLREILEEDADKYRQKLSEAKFNRFEFVSKCTREKYNDENRLKVTVSALSKIEWAGRKERLQAEIDSMTRHGANSDSVTQDDDIFMEE